MSNLRTIANSRLVDGQKLDNLPNNPLGTFLQDAPVDGKQYARKNSTWDEVVLTGNINWTDIVGKPTTFTPSAHTHTKSDITDFPTIPTKTSDLTNDSGFLTSAPVTSVAGKTGTVTLVKGDVGLGSVPNTDFTSAVAANTAKVGITPTQASDITANNSKISFDTTSSTRLANTSGTNTGDQTNISGNAATATKLATARTISGVSFDGTSNITLNNNAITNGAGYTNNTGTVTGVTGTTNRVTSSGGTAPSIDIASNYVGQTSITTLGTIGTGTWNATAIADGKISSASTWNAKQDALLSGTNIKTVNGNSLLGSGNITIAGGGGGTGDMLASTYDALGGAKQVAFADDLIPLVTKTGAETITNKNLTSADNKLFKTGTVATAAATAAKVVTLDSPDASITPTAGELYLITYTLGTTIANATLNINGSGAKNIRLANSNAAALGHNIAAGGSNLYRFDGTYFHLIGSNQQTDTNTTYIESTFGTPITAATQLIAINNLYYANNATNVAFTLPATAAINSVVEIVGMHATGTWTITAPSGDNIIIDGNDTGSAGILTGDVKTTVKLRCTVANTTWIVTDYTGTITNNTGYTTTKQAALVSGTNIKTVGGTTLLGSGDIDGGTGNIGYKNIPSNPQSTAYSLVLGDAGQSIDHPSSDANARTFTIPANSSVAYPVGTTISFSNMTSQVVTIAITTDTMYLAGAGTTGSRTLAQYGVATIRKLTSTTRLISGVGLT